MMTDAEFVREVQAYEKTLYRVSRTILSSAAAQPTNPDSL